MNAILPRPILGITMGDPAGIGPEIIVKALSDNEMTKLFTPIVIGDPTILDKAAHALNIHFNITQIDTPKAITNDPNQIYLVPMSDLDPGLANLGAPTPETGKAVEKYILKGVDLALSKDIQALVTAPITKTGLKLAGSSFHGHTELIADRTGTQNFAMMMAGHRLKVVLVTIHVPLSQVPAALTQNEILRIIDLTMDTLISRFGIPSPRLGVAGLNPHAGEDAMFGSEEETIIAPAVESAKQKGYDVQGPLPPDTVFFNAVNGRFDAVICMYHDQGLIPFKMVHFKDGVNTTIGLPIIRTSVDHGTAYDIAWTGKADETSLKEALKLAAFQATQRDKAQS